MGAFTGDASPEERCHLNPSYNRYEHRTGNGRARIIDYLIADGGAVNPPSIRSGRPLDIYLRVLYHHAVERPIVGMTLKNTEGVLVYGANTEWVGARTQPAAAGDVRVYRVTVAAHLAPGDWFLELAVAEAPGAICDGRGALGHLYVTDRRQYVGLACLDARFAEVGAARLPVPFTDPA